MLESTLRNPSHPTVVEASAHAIVPFCFKKFSVTFSEHHVTLVSPYISTKGLR